MTAATKEESAAVMDEISKNLLIKHRITIEQREVMLCFMKEHPLLATGRLQGPGAVTVKHRLLKELALKLNSHPTGAKKSEGRWLKSWQDWRVDVKQKASKVRRYPNATDGRTHRKLALSDLEEELLTFIGEAVGSSDTNLSDYFVVKAGSEPVEAHIQTDPLAELKLSSVNSTQQTIPILMPIDSSSITVEEWVVAGAPMCMESVIVSETPSPIPSLSSQSLESSASSCSRRKRKSSNMSELDERLRSNAEDHAHYSKELDPAKEQQSEAAKRQAVAAERQAEAAERQARVAERQALVAERLAAVAERQVAAAEQGARAMQSIGKGIAAAMRCMEVYLQNQRRGATS